MRAIGLFEAKTKFSELCERVARKREAVVVTRRGRPLVRIEPCDLAAPENAVWDRRAAHERLHGKVSQPFELPAREKQTWRDPLVARKTSRSKAR